MYEDIGRYANLPAENAAGDVLPEPLYRQGAPELFILWPDPAGAAASSQPAST
jgi:hypothetical protein